MFRRDILPDFTSTKNLFIFLFLLMSASSLAQTDKKYIRQGNREYEKNNFQESEISYRKAVDKNNQLPDAVFNIGDALYKQKKYEDAGKQFIETTNKNDNSIKKSEGLYNLGNSLLMANKVKESIDAYKGSLKLNPGNLEAKYNLAYAQDLLRQQEQQQQNKDNNKEDQNKDNNKEKQDKEQKNNEKEQPKDQGNNQQEKSQQQQQDQQQIISKEDAQRLLNALEYDEKKVQEKVKLAKAAKAKVKTVKNW